MKVIHILNSLLPSGAETMLCVSSDCWRGYDKYVMATAKEIGEYAGNLEAAGYKVVHIYDENLIKHFRLVCSYLRRGKFDVVHIHRESKSLYYSFAAKLANVKVIVRTVHNVFRFNGILKYRRILTRFLERTLGVTYVAIGNSVYENEKERFFNKCHIINNWADNKYKYISEEQKWISKSKRGLPKDVFCILSVGNCSAVKNHTAIITAIASLKTESEKIRYFHLGDGNQHEEEKELAQKLHVEDVICFEGRKDPSAYLEICDLFVMPSYYEGVSIAALEAMKCGISVLFSDVPGLRDFRRIDSKNISYASLDKIEEGLMNALIRFKAGNLRNSYELSEKTNETYNMEKSTAQYMKLYEKRK